MLRIFEVIEPSANPQVPGNRTWYRNFYEPLVEMGHDVVLFSPIEGRLAMVRKDTRRRAKFSQTLWEAFSREHARRPFDLVFAYLMDGMVVPAVLDDIRRVGVPTCNFSCNNIHQFDLVDELSPHVDYCLHSEKDARAKFLAVGACPVWWPMASNPKYFRPLDVPRTIPVSFVGANYALRARYVAELLSAGVEVHAYGPGWPSGAMSARSLAKRYWLLLKALTALTAGARCRYSAMLSEHDFRRWLSARYAANVHPPVSDQMLIELYSRSHICLGFLEVHEGHDPSRPVRRHVHLREFEAPMSGALYCTGYLDELAEMFEPGKEMLMYRDQNELVEIVKRYLAEPQEAERVRQAGLRRALQDHTYQRRFTMLFERLGLRRR